MARDGAFPGSEFLRKISDLTKSPTRVVAMIFILDVVLLLLQLVNSVAFVAIVSVTTIGLQISYAIPIWLRVTQARNTMPRGAFTLGPFSLYFGWIAACWLTSTSLLFFLPFQFPVTKENMNYTCVVVGTVTVVALGFWVFSARHWFKGPKRSKAEHIDDEVEM